MRSTLVVVALVVWAGLGLGSIGMAQTVASPTIHNVTLHEGAGVLTITGIGFGREPVVTIDGQSVTVLPGGTETQIAVLAPAALLSTPGSYRLNLVDPVRQVGDAFVVASQAAPVTLGSPALEGSPAATPSGASVPAGSTIAGPAVLANRQSVTGAVSPNVFEGPTNTAIGQSALQSNTSGVSNTASGALALWLNTTGNSNTATGYAALQSNTTGPDNTASGRSALHSNTTGRANTASGSSALYFNTIGFQNTASGFAALYSNTTGVSNTATGNGALYTNTTGAQNTASGDAALAFNTSGHSSAALGFNAGVNATTGSYNVFLGADVAGTAADTNTIRIGLPYNGGVGQNKTFIAGIRDVQLTGSAVQVFIDANGQLGTLTPGVQTGTFTVPMQQMADQQQQLRDQQATIADLRARLARVEALLVSTEGGK